MKKKIFYDEILKVYYENPVFLWRHNDEQPRYLKIKVFHEIFSFGYGLKYTEYLKINTLIQLKIKESKDLFLQERKLKEKNENKIEINSLNLEERYTQILNTILDTEKIYFYKEDKKYYLSIDNNILKNSEEINFYVFYVNYLSKKENKDKKILVGYNGIDAKEVTFEELKEDINKIRDSKSVLLTEIK